MQVIHLSDRIRIVHPSGDSIEIDQNGIVIRHALSVKNADEALVRAIINSKMDARHNHLNKLLDPDNGS